MAHQMVTIRGQVASPIPGAPVHGYIEPTSTVLDTQTGLVGLETIRFTPAADGTFEVQVPATDSDDLSPQGFTYRLGLRAGGIEILDVVFSAPRPIQMGPMVPPPRVIDIADITEVGAPILPSQFVDLSTRLAAVEATPSDGAALADHIASAAPHPAYDLDMQDLATLLENGMA